MGEGARQSGKLELLLVFLAGCQMPPASPTACRPTVLPRPILLSRQIVTDTGIMAVSHPCRSARILVTEPAAYFRSWAAGLAEKRIALKYVGDRLPICPDRSKMDPRELEVEFERISGETPAAANLSLYLDGSEALSALDRVVAGATCRLDVLMYMWGNDEVGWRVAQQLAVKAGPDLPVRVLVDGGGNLSQGEPHSASAEQVNRAVCWLAHQPYVQLLRSRNSFSRFDHRKLVVADNQVAWSGGRNFYQSAFESDHDLTYIVSGPLAAQMDAIFETFWQAQGASPGQHLPAPAVPEDSNAIARVVRTRALERVLYRIVGKARHHVYVENPYFSDSHLIYLLAKARQRGVDVRAVLTLQSDSPIYNRSNRVTANRLLKAGVRVYLYPGMTHVKAMAVDGVWAYTGTGNFDNLSLRHNRELGLAVSAGPVVQAIEDQLFLPDFNPEWELTEPLPASLTDYLHELIAAAAA